MKTLKGFCEENGIDINTAINVVVGDGGGILPQKIGFQGYFVQVTDDAMVFMNDVLGVKKEIPFSSFKNAEFGIGSAQLWLQCNIDGAFVAFCMTRKDWKSPVAKLILDKIGAFTEVKGMKEYNGYTGKLFFIYLWK